MFCLGGETILRALRKNVGVILSYSMYMVLLFGNQNVHTLFKDNYQAIYQNLSPKHSNRPVLYPVLLPKFDISVL